MEFKLDITDSAHKDFNDIVTYIAETLCAPAAAAHFMEAVEKCYDNLKARPLMYAAADMPELAEKGYRRAPVKNYLILYKVDETAKIVRVHRFFYGSRNYIDLI
ncbi:MAG: type II toxin-antitoxin system RelE/ParE family toxin [Oscillospiraceae bacterium]|jgi:addiction module RelE/StbE family toxin|nr:type II toxin-antitoxin system RelE/ParE family toxin [Oscillospiraceae bacterium]